MSVDGIGGGAAVSARPGVQDNGNYAALSPEMLLVYCENALGGVDATMGRLFKEQEQQRDKQVILNNLATHFGNLKDGDAVKNEARVNSDAKDPIAKAIKDANDKGLDQTFIDQLNKMQQKFDETFNPGSKGAKNEDDKIPPVVINDWISQVNAKSKEGEDASQMGMMQLQSLVSKRQQITTLVTNMLSSLNDTAKSVAGNIGR